LKSSNRGRSSYRDTARQLSDRARKIPQKEEYLDLRDRTAGGAQVAHTFRCISRQRRDDMDQSQARIEIRNQGARRPPDPRTRIFDPFFTTKVTGLGLPIAQTLIRAQGGDIRLREDHQGPGAVFVIELPSGNDSDD
jgi:signal transduction histidine kinase